MAISLKKNEGVSLKKLSANTLTQLSFGLGWAPAGRKVEEKKGFFGSMFSETSHSSFDEKVDLDANCTTYDANGSLIEAIWFRDLRNRDGSIIHTGDNRTGDGDGDDETINVDLSRLNAAVKTLVFSINSFSGQSFEKISGISCNIYDGVSRSKSLIASYNEKITGPYTAVVVAKVQKGDDGEWTITPKSVLGRGRTYQDITSEIRSII